MKREARFTATMVIAALAFMLALSSRTYGAGFVSGSTGADGAFAPTANTELQLPADGIFNFTTVDIPAGVTVTFKRNAANTPIYILATGDVNIAGTISVNGEDGKAGSTGTGNIGEGTIPVYGGKGGPGGFDGGRGGLYATIGFAEALPSAGMGPGGGKISSLDTVWSGGGGGFADKGGKAAGSHFGQVPGYGEESSAYGNVLLLPLDGGSGGGGGKASGNNGGSGGGGGGAILIASGGTINVSGNITANGGNGAKGSSSGCGGGGSGGTVRLIANVIKGNGNIIANEGSGASDDWSYFHPYQYWVINLERGGKGSKGRIRLEAYTFNRTAQTTPTASTGSPSSVFIANLPTLTITSIGGSAVPASTTGSYDTPDITMPSTTTNPVTVNISATNIPLGTTVAVMVVPVSGSSSTSTSAPLSGTDASSTTTASINLSGGTATILQASATFTVTQLASLGIPVPTIAGEEIELVKVASVAGGKSTMTFITKTGKEIPANGLDAGGISVN